MRVNYLIIVGVIVSLTSSALALEASVKKAIEEAKLTKNRYIIDAVVAKAISDFPKDAAAINSLAAAKAKPTPKVKVQQVVANKAKAKIYSGNIETGVTISSGNTNEEKANFEASLTLKPNSKWENITKLQAQTSKEEGVRSNEEYRVDNQTRYNINQQHYSFLHLDYVNDRFGGYERRTSQSLGYGRKWFDYDRFQLSSEASVGARQSDLTDGNNESEFTQTVRANAGYKMNDYVQLEQDVRVAFGGDAIITNSESNLKTKITDQWYFKVGVDVEHITDVPADRKNTDTTTKANIVYDF